MVILVLCCVKFWVISSNTLCVVVSALSAGISIVGSTCLFKFFKMDVFLWSLLKQLIIFIWSIEIMLANTFLSQLTTLKNSSTYSVDLIDWTPYSHEADLRPKIMILCMRCISQVTEVVWQTAVRITLHCSRKKLQLYMNNPQPKQYCLP